MSRRTRSQRQRTARPRGQDATQRESQAQPRTGSRRGRERPDPMAVYRGLASPSLRIRWILVAGLGLFIAARAITVADGKAVAAPADLALLGVVCIGLFLGSGFIRHYRALYRIRRDSPDAWQPTMRFAFASLAVPLGFGGPPADARERTVRRITLVLLLAYAAVSILGSRG